MSRRSGEIFDPDPLPQVPTCPEEPLDLLAEIERELPFVLFRHERPTHQNPHSEKFRDTDSIRFLKQNRLSWWNSPASRADMDDLEPPQNIYEVVEEESKDVKPHDYEDIPDDFFLRRRQQQQQQQEQQPQKKVDIESSGSSEALKLSAATNPFLNSNYDVPSVPEVDLFLQTQPSLYDLPRSPSSGLGESSSACPTSISTSISDPLDISLSADHGSAYDVPQSPPLRSPSPELAQNLYDVPSEHFATTPRKANTEKKETLADVYCTFPRTRRGSFGPGQSRQTTRELPSPPSLSSLMGCATDTYDIPFRPESVSDRSDFLSILSESAYDVPLTVPPPSSPPPPPPPQEEPQRMRSPPPVPMRPSMAQQTQSKPEVSPKPRPPPVPAPRQKIPPPLPPKQETTPPRSRLSEQRKFSLQPTPSGSPPIKESVLRKWESGTSLTSWYLDTNQIRNCDIPHRELTGSSEESEPSPVPTMPNMTPTKTPIKSQSPSQKGGTRRITTAIKTVSNHFKRKPSIPVTTSSESWDSNSADSDTADGVTIYFSGDGRKDYSKRICVISDGTLKFYDLEASSSPSLCLCCDEITLMLARRDICASTRTIPALFLVDIRVGNSTRSLGFTSAIERAEFLRRVNHWFNPQSLKLQGEVWASGVLKCRFSASGDWQNVKAVLHGKEFTPFPLTNDNEPSVGGIDLRKAMLVEWTSSEEGQEKLFHIVLPCRTIYLRGPSTHETNSWFELLSKTHSTYLDKSLLSEQYLNSDNVPLAIQKCVNFVSAHGSDTTGVYRLAGSHGKIERLVDALRKNAWDVHLIPETYSTHDVANALKRFLRTFDDCLLTQRLYDQWMQCSRIESLDERLPRLKDLISELPLVEHSTLRFLCSHLKAIADRADINCMTVANLASIFGPTILYKHSGQAYLERDPSLSPTTSMVETNAGMAVAADLLGNFCFLFDVSQAVVEKEREIQKFIAELREARVAQRPAGDILVGVYVYNKEWGRCINVKLTPTMTAAELCKLVRSQLKLVDSVSSLAVFEVICDQQLERPLHFTESVFEAVLQWTGWDPAFAKDNYLLVKRNFVFEDVVNFLNMKEPLSNFSEVKFAAASAKTFKKVSMEFAKSAVQLLKDRKERDKEKVVLKEWRVEDISVYVGCEANRKAPSKFCLAFVPKNEHVRKSRDRPFLCHTLSLPTQVCHTSWLASVLCAQHPNLIPPEEELPDLLTL